MVAASSQLVDIMVDVNLTKSLKMFNSDSDSVMSVRLNA